MPVTSTPSASAIFAPLAVIVPSPAVSVTALSAWPFTWPDGFAILVPVSMASPSVIVWSTAVTVALRATIVNTASLKPTS